jgi:protein O-GlcNAc transferase
MDLSLDTFPYAGTTTTCEALYVLLCIAIAYRLRWMGVPVITLQGKDSHAHNVGVSLLSNIGYHDLVAKSKEEYINLAIKLANDVDRLKRYRATLRQTMLTSPLCQGEPFTREIEQHYQEIWKTYISRTRSK